MTTTPENNLCPCGTAWFPIGGKHNPDGLFIRIEHRDGVFELPLTHNSDIFLSAGQIFTTSSIKIKLNSNIEITNISLYSPKYQLSLSNSIRILFRIGSRPISDDVIGTFGNSFFSSKINNEHIYFESPIDCDSLQNINLFDTRIILDIYSLCKTVDDDCCDKLPSSLTLSNYSFIIDCPTTTTITTTSTTTTIPPTTTTTLPPLGSCCEVGIYWDDQSNDWIEYRNCLGVMTEQECDPRQGYEGARIWNAGQTCDDECEIQNPCSLNIPDTFIYTVVGYGALSGQEKQVIVNKVGDSWIAQGTWPCGINFAISMRCDANINKFVYDGFFDCGGGTKTIAPPSDIPYIYPNIKSPLIISYSDISGCPEDCKKCCDWDGKWFIEFPQTCFNSRRLELQFIKIGENIWEVNQETDCGDVVQIIVSCNPDVAANDAASCLQKWKVLYFNVSCATNPRVVYNVLELCECGSPPVVAWAADSFDNCQCCCEDFSKIMPGTTATILPLGINVVAGDSISVVSTGRIVLAADGRFTDAPTKLEIYIGSTLISVNENLTNFVSTLSGEIGVRYRDDPHTDNTGQYNLSIKVCPKL
jgi:hypothetical protein